MQKTVLLAALGALLVACDSATEPEPRLSTLSASNDGETTSTQGIPVFTGRGIAVDATVLGANSRICDTGPLPRAGGRIEQVTVNASMSGVLSTTKAYCVTTSVDNNRGISEGTVWNLSLNVAGNVIAADWVHSMAGAQCPPLVTSARSTGRAFATNLRINGRTIAINSNVINQKFELPNGYVVVNEHTSFVTPYHAGRTVIGLHIVITQPGQEAEIFVARAQTHIDCP